MAYVYKAGEFEEIASLYANGQSLVDIQSLFPDKSVASIRMKLVKAGLYTAVVVKKQDKTQPIGLTIASPTPKPTTKAEILLAYKTAESVVGFAPF